MSGQSGTKSWFLESILNLVFFDFKNWGSWVFLYKFWKVLWYFLTLNWGSWVFLCKFRKVLLVLFDFEWGWVGGSSMYDTTYRIPTANFGNDLPTTPFGIGYHFKFDISYPTPNLVSDTISNLTFYTPPTP